MNGIIIILLNYSKIQVHVVPIHYYLFTTKLGIIGKSKIFHYCFSITNNEFNLNSA